MYTYSAYNKLIMSDIKLPIEALSDIDIANKQSIHVHLGSIPRDIVGDTLLDSISYFIRDDIIYVDAPSIARYLVKNKIDIIVEPYPGATEALIGLVLVHLVMMFVIKEKTQLLFHGSAFTLPNCSEACILLGNKGAGKSTLAATFSLFGCKVLCDDLIPVKSGPMVQPGVPLIKLLEDSYKSVTKKENIDNDYSDGQGKYHIQVEHSIHQAELKTICILEKGDVDEVKIIELKGGKKLHSILPHIRKIKQIDTEASVFNQLLEYSNSIKVFSVIRPEGFIDPYTTATTILDRITYGESTK